MIAKPDLLAAMLVAAVITVGCGSESRRASELDRDIDRICHAERHSGALEQPEGYRQMAVAQWLANNLRTEEARKLLIELTALAPKEKVARLEASARKAGLKHCDLAQSWGG